jgi:hypothetical protein
MTGAMAWSVRSSFVQVDEFDAHGVAAGLADIAGRGCAPSARHTVMSMSSSCRAPAGADDRAGLLGGLHGDDALAAARLNPVFVEGGAFADPVLAGDQQGGVGIHHCQRHDLVFIGQVDAL